jgi:hypothetical protein
MVKDDAPIGVIGPGDRDLGVTGVILRLIEGARTNHKRVKDIPRDAGQVLRRLVLNM